MDKFGSNPWDEFDYFLYNDEPVVRKSMAKMRCPALLRDITVEPILFLYMLGIFVQYILFQDLIYEKTCIGLFNNASVCGNLTGNTLTEVQRLSSHLIMWSTLAMVMPILLVAIYLGSWSDRFGRKLPLYFPPAGAFVSCLLYIWISADDTVSVNYVIVGSFVSGVGGGFVACIMTCMSYVTGIDSSVDRTVRIARLEAMTFLGGTIGPFLSGALLSAIGHAYSFVIIAVFNVLAMLYTWCFVPDVTLETFDEEEDDERSWCTRYLSLTHFKEAVITCFRKRTGNDRSNIFLVLLCSMIIMITTSGEMDVVYLYSKNDPLKWTPAMYSYYFGMKFAAGFFTLIVIMPFLKYLQLQDTTVCFIGLISRIAGLVLLGFSSTTGLMFLVPFVSLLSYICIPALRSCLSKLVTAAEQGKMFSFMAIIEDTCTILASLIYNGLYPWTLTFFSGFLFVASAVVLLIPAIIVSGLYFMLKRRHSMESILVSGGTSETTQQGN